VIQQLGEEGLSGVHPSLLTIGPPADTRRLPQVLTPSI
jgi:hypothetical protein